VLLMFALIFHRWLLEPVLWLLAIGSTVTVIQRVHHVWCQIARDLPEELVALTLQDRAWSRAFKRAARGFYGEQNYQQAERQHQDAEPSGPGSDASAPGREVGGLAGCAAATTAGTWSQRLSYWGYLAVWEAPPGPPTGWRATCRNASGGVVRGSLVAAARDQVRRNLRRVVPDASPTELRDLVRAAYVSYARYWLDSFRLHTMDGSHRPRHRGGGAAPHRRGPRQRPGGLFATGHLGSWDVGAFFTAQRDWGMVVVAEVVEPRPLFERFVRLRQQAGIDVIPLVRGGNMLDQLETRITEQGQLATLLADRDLTRKGRSSSSSVSRAGSRRGPPCSPGARGVPCRSGRS
jgi:hypothetical protein